MVSYAFKVEIVDGAVVTVLATPGYLASTATTAPSIYYIYFKGLKWRPWALYFGLQFGHKVGGSERN